MRIQRSNKIKFCIFIGLKLPKTVVDKLYRENAMRWYKLPSSLKIKEVAQLLH